MPDKAPAGLEQPLLETRQGLVRFHRGGAGGGRAVAGSHFDPAAVTTFLAMPLDALVEVRKLTRAALP